MSGCVCSTQNQTSGSRFFRNPGPSLDALRERETTSRRTPSLFDPTRVNAVTDAIRRDIIRGTRTVSSLARRLEINSYDAEDDRSSHAMEQHLWYPPIRSLQPGDDARLFVPGATKELRELVQGLPDGTLRWRAIRDALQHSGLYRLSDVHENPWILKAGTATFAGPCELTDEATRTWIMKLKITTKLICLTMQELHEQDWQLCQEHKEECFGEIDGQCLEKLFEVASSFSNARWSDGHIPQQLTIFDALIDILFSIRHLCLVRSGEVAGIVNKMLNAFRGVIVGTKNEIYSCTESTIDPATFVLIQVLEFFGRNRDMVQPMLESGGYNTDSCSDMFHSLVSKLKEGMFQEKGQRYIFILNNAYYVLQMKCHPDLLLPNVVSNLESLIDQYIMRYLDECWFPPVLSYLIDDSLKKPHCSSLDKFTGEFFSICDRQMTWKVRTELKQILREDIVSIIVPKYVSFSEALQANPSSCWYSQFKGMWCTRSEKPDYTGAQLEQVIRELFER